MSNDNKDDERSATVIPWPGARAATPPTDAGEPKPDVAATTAPSAGAAASDAGEEFSIDAFEEAVRRAVQDKLGGDETPRFPPRGADDLVAQVFSALSGKDGKTALAEVRERLASGGGQGGEGAPVIDLAAAREARKVVATEATSRISGALKDTFGQFMAQLSASQGNRSEIVLDAGFFKEHGASLLGNLFQGLASALMQRAKPADGAPAARPADPTADAPPSPAAEPATTAAPTDAPAPSDAGPSEAAPQPRPAPEQVQVNVKVDFASILSSLFSRRTAAPPRPPEGSEPPKA